MFKNTLFLCVTYAGSVLAKLLGARTVLSIEVLLTSNKIPVRISFSTVMKLASVLSEDREHE